MADEHNAAFRIVRCMQSPDPKSLAYLRRIFRVCFMSETEFDLGVLAAKAEGWMTNDGVLTEAGENAFPEYRREV